jgi:hypothetical protein
VVDEREKGKILSSIVSKSDISLFAFWVSHSLDPLVYAGGMGS